MIFKIREDTCEEGTWHFFDNIVRASLHHNRKPPDNWPLSEDELSMLSADLEENTPVMIIKLEFQNVGHKIIRFMSDAYLLNDDGKTIERL